MCACGLSSQSTSNKPQYVSDLSVLLHKTYFKVLLVLWVQTMVIFQSWLTHITHNTFLIHCLPKQYNSSPSLNWAAIPNVGYPLGNVCFCSVSSREALKFLTFFIVSFYKNYSWREFQSQFWLNQSYFEGSLW